MLDSKQILLERGKRYGCGKVQAKKIIETFNAFRNQDLEVEDLYIIMIMLKLYRECVQHNEDNLLDLKGYTDLLHELSDDKEVV